MRPLFNRFYRIVVLLPDGKYNLSSLHYFSSWNPWGARFTFRSAHSVLVSLGHSPDILIVSVHETDEADHVWLSAHFAAQRQRAKLRELRPSDQAH